MGGIKDSILPMMLVALVTSIITLATVSSAAGALISQDSQRTFGTKVVELQSAMSVPGGVGRTSTTTELELPDGAPQGRNGTWYLIDARLVLESSSNQRSNSGGIATVNISSNGRTVALLEVNAGNDGGLGPFIHWNTFELLSGPARGLALGKSVELRFANHFALEGLQPGGKNELALILDQKESVLDSVRLETGSAIWRGNFGPPSLKIASSMTATCFGHDRIIHVDVTAGGTTIRRFGVEFIPPPGTIVLDEPIVYEEFNGHRRFDFQVIQLGHDKEDFEGVLIAGGANLQRREMKVLDPDDGC